MSHETESPTQPLTLRDWRKARGLNQRKAALELGLSQQGYAKIEQGLRHPRPVLAKKIIDHTGVKLEVLMGIAS